MSNGVMADTEITRLIRAVRHKYPHARLYWLPDVGAWVIVQPLVYFRHEVSIAHVPLRCCREISARCESSDEAWRSVKL